MQMPTPRMFRRSLCAFAIIVLWAASGCNDIRDNRIENQLDDDLAAADKIYQFGCDPNDVCGNGKVVCENRAEQALQRRSSKGKGSVIRHYGPASIIGNVPSVWVIESDGSGTYYWENRSDIRPCPDCGWHKKTFGEGEMLKNGSYVLKTGEEDERAIQELRSPRRHGRCSYGRPDTGDAGDAGDAVDSGDATGDTDRSDLGDADAGGDTSRPDTGPEPDTGRPDASGDTDEMDARDIEGDTTADVDPDAADADDGGNSG